ncbi:hypothetical protein [Flavobacterium reichenbachii]|uniref:hypothetical protein n=1 Tax=Flavobacterium reichenbachii TaxID=362418 RepID=UPI000690FC78|nr:hypothetical protein [Flavobacterium reichenbachii]OXB17609.1 hypothetical protein B0A68_04780 [Flavobacterium reichenbachii]
MNQNSNSINKIFNSFFTKEIRILIGLGLLFRALLSVLYFHVTIFPDSEGYLFLAKKISEFNLDFYNGERSLGYPLFISLAFNSVVVTVVYQVFLGIITSVYWYKTILNFNFSSKKALCLTLFLQSFLQIHFYERIILVESLTLFFVSLLFYYLSSDYLESKNIKKDLAVGFVLGILVLIKPFYAFIPFVIYGLSVIKNFRFSKFISSKIIILIFPLLAYFGWSYVNKVNTGYFVSTTFFGLNLSQNCVYFAEKTTQEYHWIGSVYAKTRENIIVQNKKLQPENRKEEAMTIWDAQNELIKKTDHNFPKLSAVLGRYAIATIKKNPLEYAKQVVLRSWFDFWKPKLYWNYNNFSFPFVNKIFLGIWYLQTLLIWFFKLSFVFLIPYYLIQFFKNRIISKEVVFITIIFAVSVLQALVTYGGNARFSFPFEYIMMLVVILFIKENFNKKKAL